MSTVVRRTFKSTPARPASTTWRQIVELLTQGRDGTARKELLAVEGVAASIITDKAALDAAIVVTCDGPRTRIYCIYDDAAIEGDDTNEDALGYDPLKGDWAVSLPCEAEDLPWVQNALKQHSSRITARDKAEAGSTSQKTEAAAGAALEIDLKGFLGT